MKMEYYETYGKNPACLKCLNRDTRSNYSENGLCNQALSIHDGLACRCVGSWAKEKITRLVKYFQIFSTGMKYKWNNQINYIEVCSGSGICIERDNGIEFDGTALSILKNEGYEFLNKVIFIDNDPEVVSILNMRISNLGVTKAYVLLGDYTDSIGLAQLIASKIDKNSLNLVFIDPTDCSVPFDTIKALKILIGNIDFIINVATKTDFNRNITNILRDHHKNKKLKSKYESFLGSDIFSNEDFIQASMSNKLDISRSIFREAYMENFKNLGYQHFDLKEVHGYYDLLFATAHAKGIEFWKKANKYDPYGQSNMFE